MLPRTGIIRAESFRKRWYGRLFAEEPCNRKRNCHGCASLFLVAETQGTVIIKSREPSVIDETFVISIANASSCRCVESETII